MTGGAQPWDGLTGPQYSAAIDRAVTDGRISADDWRQEVYPHLERAYLSASTIYGGSGSGGDGHDWRRKRGVIAQAINRDGSFLDVGCANGLLMESIVPWAAERGYRLEPFGLDVSLALVEHAAARLPTWAGHFFVGDAGRWQPPRRFDFVRTESMYAPPGERRALLDHLLAVAVAPGGRLIVCCYGGGEVTAELTEMGLACDGVARAYRDDGRLWTSVAWIDCP